MVDTGLRESRGQQAYQLLNPYYVLGAGQQSTRTTSVNLFKNPLGEALLSIHGQRNQVGDLNI